MVDEDIQKAKEKLETQRQLAQQYVGEKIPQRRYGSGITREQQQQILQRRGAARTALKQVASKEKELAQIQAERAEASRQQAEYEQQKAEYEAQLAAYNRRLELIRQAEKLIFAGKTRAAQGDPELLPIINELLEKGQRSADQLIRQREALKGTYDPSKGVYTDPTGQRFSMAFENIPEGTKVIPVAGDRLVSTYEGIKSESQLLQEKITATQPSPKTPENILTVEPAKPISTFDKIFGKATQPLGTLYGSIQDIYQDAATYSQQSFTKRRKKGGVKINLMSFQEAITEPFPISFAKRTITGSSITQDPKLIAAGYSESVYGGAAFAGALIKDPVSTTTEVVTKIPDVPLSVAKGAGIAVVQPERAVGFLAGELISGSLVSQAAEAISKPPARAVTKISDIYAPIDEGVIKLSSVKPRKSITAVKGGKVGITALDDPIRAGLPDIKIAGNIGSPTLPVETLAKQISVAGQKVDAVSGAKGFFDVFKEEVKIYKPDAVGLEAGFFADPRTRLRPSRIGLSQPSATPLDILSGQVTFKKTKPQAILLPQTPVEKLPKSLIKIEKKFKANVALTPKETKRFYDFLLKPTGKFKPVGYVRGGEPEIFLSPLETVRKRGVVGKTIIGGQPVTIYSADIKPLSTKTIELISKPKLTRTEAKSLLKQVKKETGFDISGYRTSTKSYISPSVPAYTISKISYASPTKPSKALSLPTRITKTSPSMTSQIARISRLSSITGIPIRSPTRTPKKSPTRSLTRTSPTTKLPPYKIPTTPITTPKTRKRMPNLLGEKKRIKTKKKTKKLKEDIYYIPSFTARALDIKGKINLGKISKTEASLGIRPIPIK